MDKIDWEARSLAYRIILSGMPSRGGQFASVAEWWADRLRTRPLTEWQSIVDGIEQTGRIWAEQTNVARAMVKLGIEPTGENYLRLAIAGRELLKADGVEIPP